MNGGHLSNDELIERLYGIGRNPHRCPDCDQRLDEIEARRAEVSASPAPPSDFLAAQRRAIYSRLGENPKSGARWVPAAVGASCLAVGLAVAGLIGYHPVSPAIHPVSVATHSNPRADAAAADEQLYSDVYAMEQSAEPRAAAPMNALVEEN